MWFKGGKGAKMLNRILRLFAGAGMIALLMSVVAAGMTSVFRTTESAPPNPQLKDLQDRVRHTILMLPDYGVFDDINFTIEGDKVTLSGAVRRAILRSETAIAVSKTDGVANVVNNIEILPLSSMDDSLRTAAYRAIYSKPGFEKYEVQAVKPIRIIVKNSNITLSGRVASPLDKALAETAARNVPFAFSVTDNLAID
jgi:hyperosmotically inducible periplasmic protein